MSSWDKRMWRTCVRERKHLDLPTADSPAMPRLGIAKNTRRMRTEEDELELELLRHCLE